MTGPINAVVLSGTPDLDTAVTELARRPRHPGKGKWPGLSPLKENHLNCPGRYAFAASKVAAAPVRPGRPRHRR